MTPIRLVRDYVQAAGNRSRVELPERGQLILYAEPARVVETLRSLFGELSNVA